MFQCTLTCTEAPGLGRSCSLQPLPIKPPHTINSPPPTTTVGPLFGQCMFKDEPSMPSRPPPPSNSLRLPPPLLPSLPPQLKLQSEQESQRMEFVLLKEKQEAERKRIEAQGIADFQDIVSKGGSRCILGRHLCGLATHDETLTLMAPC